MLYWALVAELFLFRFSVLISLWLGQVDLLPPGGQDTSQRTPFSWPMPVTDLFHCISIDGLMIFHISTVLITLFYLRDFFFSFFFYLRDFSFCLRTFSNFFWETVYLKSVCNQPSCPVGSRANRMNLVSSTCLWEFWSLPSLLHPCSYPLQPLTVHQHFSLGLTPWVYMHTSPTGLEDKNSSPYLPPDPWSRLCLDLLSESCSSEPCQGNKHKGPSAGSWCSPARGWNEMGI